MKKVTIIIIVLLVIILVAVTGLQLRLGKEKYTDNSNESDPSTSSASTCYSFLKGSGNSDWVDIANTSSGIEKSLLNSMIPSSPGNTPMMPCMLHENTLRTTFKVPDSLPCVGSPNNANQLQFTGKNDNGYCLFDFNALTPVETKERLKMTADLMDKYYSAPYSSAVNAYTKSIDEYTRRAKLASSNADIIGYENTSLRQQSSSIEKQNTRSQTEIDNNTRETNAYNSGAELYNSAIKMMDEQDDEYEKLKKAGVSNISSIPSDPIINIQSSLLSNLSTESRLTDLDIFTQPSFKRAPIYYKTGGYKDQSYIDFEVTNDRNEDGSYMYTKAPIKVDGTNGITLVLQVQWKGYNNNGWVRILNGNLRGTNNTDAFVLSKVDGINMMQIRIANGVYIPIYQNYTPDKWMILIYRFNPKDGMYEVGLHDSTLTKMNVTTGTENAWAVGSRQYFTMGLGANNHARDLDKPAVGFGNFKLGALIVYDRYLNENETRFLYHHVKNGRAN